MTKQEIITKLLQYKSGIILTTDMFAAIQEYATSQENDRLQSLINKKQNNMNKENLEKELFAIFASEETDLKSGSDGDYETVKAISMYSYSEVAAKITSLIQAITDPENQPNQYGI